MDPRARSGYPLRAYPQASRAKAADKYHDRAEEGTRPALAGEEEGQAKRKVSSTDKDPNIEMKTVNVMVREGM